MKKELDGTQMTIFDDGLIEDVPVEENTESVSEEPVPEETDEPVEEEKPTKDHKKGIKIPKNLFRNKRGLLTGICLLLAAAICFVAVPIWASGNEKQISVVRVRAFVASGTEIRADHIETVRLTAGSVPSQAIRKEADVVGKIAQTSLYPGDYIQSAKISEGKAFEDMSSLQVRQGKIAISVSLTGSSSALASKLRRGDVVSVFCYDADETIAFIPAELRAVRVISLTNSQGKEITDAEPGNPSAITLLLNEIQGARLFELEKTCEIRFALICESSDTARASALLQSQQNYFEDN